MNTVFSAYQMVKFYPDFTLGPLEFELEAGTILGFVGPNGAGKTTTIHCLAGMVSPDRGGAVICGLPQDRKDPSWKQNIGFVGEERPFFENWTGAQNLAFQSSFFNTWDDRFVSELAGRLDLALGKKVSELSKGNKVKLGIIAALAHSPRLLLFDEPTEGLDPVVRAEAIDVFREFMEEEGRAVFYSTHVLADISRLADELAFINDGKVILREQTDHLTDRWRQILFQITEEIPPVEAVLEHRQERDEHRIVSSDYEATLAHLQELGAENVHVSHLGIDEIAVALMKDLYRSRENA